MSCTLFLMSEKGYAVISSICANGFSDKIQFVVSSKDKNVLKDYYDEVKEKCIEYFIPFYDKSNVPEILSTYCIAVSWRWIINLNNTKLIVLHDSILPKYRGFAPLVNMLINNESEIGVTAIFADKDYDKGDMILWKKKEIYYPIKISKAIELISDLYSEIVLKILNKIYTGITIDAYPQDEEDASYSLWRDEKDYGIDWNESSDYIKRFIDSVGFPYKGAYTIYDGRIIRVYDAEVVPDVRIENRCCGKTLFFEKGLPIVVCGEGLLKLIDVRDDSTLEKIDFKKFRIRFQ